MKAAGESAGTEKIAWRADGRGQPSWRRLRDQLQEITAESSPGSLPFPRPLPSRCQICREIASGRGAQNGSCSWELGQQTQKGKQASLGPQIHGASQLPTLCVHSLSHTHIHTRTQGRTGILTAPAITARSRDGGSSRRPGYLVATLHHAPFLHTCLLTEMG